MNIKNSFCLGLLALWVLESPNAWSQKKKDGIQETKKIVPVEKRDLLQRVNFSGRITPRKVLKVFPPFKGYVQKIYVKQGDRVKLGDPLVSMSQTPSMSGLQGEVFPIRSSVDGVVVQVQRDVGEYVEESSNNEAQNMIMRIDDRSELYVDAEITEMDYPKIKIGQQVIIRPTALSGSEYNGVITKIAGASKSQDRWERFRVEYESKTKIINPDDRLFSGMTVMIDVITGKAEKVLSLPITFVQRDDKGEYYITTEKEEKKSVAVGLQTDEYFEVKSGVAEGERVKIASYLSL